MAVFCFEFLLTKYLFFVRIFCLLKKMHLQFIIILVGSDVLSIFRLKYYFINLYEKKINTPRKNNFAELYPSFIDLSPIFSTIG